MMTPERIKELRDLLAKATPGPWRRTDSDDPHWLCEVRAPDGGFITFCGTNTGQADAALIVAAVNALDELLTDYENHRALAQRADRMREALREIAGSFPAHGDDDAWIEGARDRARKAISEGA